MDHTDPTTQPLPSAGEELLHIPPSVYVGCPMAPCKLRPMEKCPNCEHFVGLADRFGESSLQPFAVRYMLRCAHPRHLPLTEIEQ